MERSVMFRRGATPPQSRPPSLGKGLERSLFLRLLGLLLFHGPANSALGPGSLGHAAAYRAVSIGEAPTEQCQFVARTGTTIAETFRRVIGRVRREKAPLFGGNSRAGLIP